MKMSKAGLFVLALSGCATPPEKITGNFVSPSTYSSYSCKQIISERNLVTQKVNELTGIQKKKASNDAALTGVGAILFWPALIGLAAGSDVEPQLASMKGNFDALTAAGTQKGCF